MSIISAQSVTRTYGPVVALDSISFDIEHGEIFGLLGPNGGGKTTTVRILCCLISPTAGSAKIGDYSVNDKNDAARIRRMIGYVPDNPGLYETLSAYSNLEFYGKIYGTPDKLIKENIEKYLKMFDLWEKKNEAVGTFSKGMRQKIALARSLIHEPDLLILDEPTANLDPESAAVIRNVILQLKKEGKTILLNTHNLDEAQRICDRIGILNKRIIALGRPKDLQLSVAPRITLIQLNEVTDAIRHAVLATNPRRLDIEGNTLRIEMADPENETPEIVTAITSVGGRIKSVDEETRSLEDVYFKLMKEGLNGHS